MRALVAYILVRSNQRRIPASFLNRVMIGREIGSLAVGLHTHLRLVDDD